MFTFYISNNNIKNHNEVVFFVTTVTAQILKPQDAQEGRKAQGTHVFLRILRAVLQGGTQEEAPWRERGLR